LWQSIVATVVGLCCLIPGLVGVPGIVFASQASGAKNQGQPDVAREKARLARIFTWISAGLTLLVIVAYAALLVIGVATTEFDQFP
jgi:hypothetical protein